MRCESHFSLSRHSYTNPHEPPAWGDAPDNASEAVCLRTKSPASQRLRRTKSPQQPLEPRVEAGACTTGKDRLISLRLSVSLNPPQTERYSPDESTGCPIPVSSPVRSKNTFSCTPAVRGESSLRLRPSGSARQEYRPSPSIRTRHELNTPFSHPMPSPWLGTARRTIGGFSRSPHRHNCGVDPRVQVPSTVHTPNDRVPSKSGGFPLIRAFKAGILPHERTGNPPRSEEFVRFDGCAGMSEAPTPSGRRPRHPSGARRCVARGSPERESPERGRRLRHEESRRGQRARADGKHGDG